MCRLADNNDWLGCDKCGQFFRASCIGANFSEALSEPFFLLPMKSMYHKAFIMKNFVHVFNLLYYIVILYYSNFNLIPNRTFNHDSCARAVYCSSVLHNATVARQTWNKYGSSHCKATGAIFETLKLIEVNFTRIQCKGKQVIVPQHMFDCS